MTVKFEVIAVVFTALLCLLCPPLDAVTCYACNGQCSPFSPTDSNVTTTVGCSSCQYVVAYGGFGDLSSIEDVGMPLCSNTQCSNGDEDAYSFQYVLNSYVYTMPAYSTCCNSDLCNNVSGAESAAAPLMWLLAGSVALVATVRC